MAILNVEMLTESGSFVGKPVKQKIEWNVGSKKFAADVYIKLASYDTTIAEFQMQKENGVDQMVSRILSSVVDKKGNPILKVEHILGDPETGEGKMCSSLFLALVGALNKSNGLVDEDNEEVDGKK